MSVVRGVWSRGRLTCRAAVAVEEAAASGGSSTGSETTVRRDDIRNVAIVAHVDHGKTTLVDSMLRQSNIFRENQSVATRIMDSDALEKERGITILSKNTAITYKGTRLNIIDTPGHADFGGEVERIMNMVDGVLLLVDSVEGPMPQTRFVLRKALEAGHRVVVVVNKIDRSAARPEFVVDSTFELFCELGASDAQCDFPIVYASGFSGIAGMEPDELTETLEPLFETIVDEVPPPEVSTTTDVKMLVTNIDYDEHKGRIAIGRVNSGTLTKGASVTVRTPETPPRPGKLAELFVFDNFARKSVDRVEAGDICAICGVQDIGIGETILSGASEPLPSIKVEEPTVRMTFQVNTSPFAGKEGKYVTTRNINDRLERELERNLAMKVEKGESADTFVVCGRGTLHIGILIENMRREGYEFAIGPPQVIMKEGDDGKKLEPVEEAIVEVSEEYVGAAIELFGARNGSMLDMSAGDDGITTIKYKIPTRGLLGLKNALLTATRGTGVINTIFSGYEVYSGEISTRETGSLVAHETGQTTTYALMSAQDRGIMFVNPGEEVYEGQIVGIHQRAGDLKVNVCKRKAMTNVRANKDATVVLNAPRELSLDDSIEYIENDELVEVTPVAVRLRKAGKVK